MARIYAPRLKTVQGQSVKIGDIEMYYEELGQGQPLVLLHGFGGCSQNWHLFAEDLAADYRLIIVDLPGHGHSNNPANQFTHRMAAKDVFLLMDHLDLDRFSAMGMSTGAMILLHMATSQPERISSMVLISATTHFPEQAKNIMRRTSFDTMPAEVREMYRECAKRGDEQIRQLITQFNAFSENPEDMDFDAQSLSKIRARTLLVHGDRDNFFPPEIALRLYRGIPNAALWIVPAGEHVPVFDPELPFTATALRFLGGSTQQIKE